MADVITFKGETIFDSADTDDTGIGWSFSPGALVQEANEVGPSIGIGYWVKPGNVATSSHTLDLQWRTATPATIRVAIEALATATTGALVIPIWGTIAKLRLSGVGAFECNPSDSGKFTLKTSLTFTGYP